MTLTISPDPIVLDQVIKTVRVYVDIDGVYNQHYPPFPSVVFPPNHIEAKWAGQWNNDGLPVSFFESVPDDVGDTFHICWSSELIEEFNKLVELPYVEFVWCTTWRDKARIFAEKVGLNATDWRFFDASWDRIVDKDKQWWKQEAIRQDLIDNPVNKALWIDDELNIRHDSRRWAESNGLIVPIAPRPHIGIDKDMFDFIKASLAL